MSVSDADLIAFRFRNLHPQVFLGTTSDRYAGWLGQIYSPETYKGRITRRTRTLGGKVYVDEVLPVESVREYFLHFPALEIDFTFYRPLLTAAGQPTPNFHVLRNYAGHLGPDDRVVLKVPQAVFAQKVRKAGEYIVNPDYLNAELFRDRFYLPALDILGTRIQAFLFEQEYQRRKDQKTPEAFAADLERFFHDIPADSRYHVELRTPGYLAEPVYTLLRSGGAGLVLSHWTWLPPLRRQFLQASGADFNAGGDMVIRLLTPRNMTYEKTYALAHPFDRLIEGMLSDATVEETVEIIRGVVQRGSRIWLFVNNRAGGNAPLIAQRLVREFQKSV